MKYSIALLLPIFLLTAELSFAQQCDTNRFTNAEYFQESDIESAMNITYATALNYKDETQELQMDLYFPSASKDKMEKRPLILLIHGGGFTKGKREGMAFMCQQFAQRGFVAATMSYRLGMKTEDAAGNGNATYRAQQDANAALRYLVANASEYKIDTDWIFIGGTSAGAITSLATVYATQFEWNAGYPGVEENLGPLNSSGNDLTNTFQIKGIFNTVGAITPMVLQPQEFVPMVSFHGTDDRIVAVDNGYIGLGSRGLHKVLEEAGICNDLSIVPGGRHNVYQTEEGILYRIERTSCFFKSLMCDSCTSYASEVDTPASCSE